MSEVIDRVSVAQDDDNEWWLEFYSDDMRHGVKIEDVRDGLASYVNLQVKNAALHERADDAAAELARMREAVEAVRPLIAVLAEMKGKDWTKFQYWNFHPVGEDNIDKAAAWLEKYGVS